MATKLRFDEVNALGDYLREIKGRDGTLQKVNPDDLIDEILDILVMEYVLGTEQANESIDADVQPNADKMSKAIYKKFDGKDYSDRVREYTATDDVDGIIRVMETDSTRVYNDGVLNAGIESKKTLMKRWNTILDGRERDSHHYLDGMEVPINSRFYTYDGDSADYPGGFELAENNVNCRCTIDLVSA